MTNILPLLQQNKKRFSILEKAGRLGDETRIEIYVVGGYVRDLLMRRTLKDIDIMVVGDGIDFARQLAYKLGIKKIVPFKEFGTAAIPYEEGHIEVASARHESYEPGSRKPKVTYLPDERPSSDRWMGSKAGANLKGDLSRRDFTINAMAISLRSTNLGELFDPFGGIQDLQKKIIRTPLDPDSTFSDDPLRMIRAIRFATQLEFQIERTVIESLKRQVERIEIVSAERITQEFYKILDADRPSIGLELLQHVGLMEIIFPEISAMAGMEQPTEWHHKDIFYHTLQVVDNICKMTDKSDLRFAALVHDIAKPQTRKFNKEKGWTFHGHDAIGSQMLEKVAKRMRLSNQTKEFVQKLIFLHLRPIALAQEGVTDSAIRRLIVTAGDDIQDLMMLCRADITTRNPKLVRRYLGNFDRVERRIHEVIELDELKKFQSPVRGDVIMKECGIKPGPLVGKIKRAIEDAILDGKIKYDYDAAYEYLLKIKDNYLSREAKSTNHS